MSASYPDSIFTDGPGGLKRLPDGSLVDRDRYFSRYSRGPVAPTDREHDLRTEAERDRGRLAYSSVLRRLAGVTQVVSPDLTAARMHTRESHTHKVALVARELAQHVIRLAEAGHEGAVEVIRASGGLDIAACEAAGLAHDLGHAPFGHAGERTLHREMIKPNGSSGRRLSDGFEGNPQSFRIVTRLAGGKGNERLAMGLTNVTLCAILKYPWLREDAPMEEPSSSGATEGPRTDDDQRPLKFGAYVSDEDAFKLARQGVMGEGWEGNRRQSLEAAIMDLADDIAYAAHDLEDFVTAEMIDMHDVKHELLDIVETFRDQKEIPEASGIATARNPFLLAASKIRSRRRFDRAMYYRAAAEVLDLTTRVLERSPNDETLPAVLRSALNERIGLYFANLEVDTNVEADEPFVRLTAEHWHEIQVLKTIPRHWLISSPRMGVIQQAQKGTIRSLVNSLIEWVSEPDVDTAALPEGLRQTMRAAGVDLSKPIGSPLSPSHFRAIADYVCGMSDSEALLRAGWFAGREIPGMAMVVESA